MKLLTTLLYTVTLPLALAHPFQDDHLPTKLQERVVHNGTDFEHDVELMLKRGVNAACVASMAVCLGTFNLQFIYGKTPVPQSWATAWATCGAGSVASGACFSAGGTNSLPEPGFIMKQMRGFKEATLQCNNVACPNFDTSPCEPLGCEGCQAFAAPPPGPMGPPSLPNPRCVD